jgi:hypothetical protein
VVEHNEKGNEVWRQCNRSALTPSKYAPNMGAMKPPLVKGRASVLVEMKKQLERLPPVSEKR